MLCLNVPKKTTGLIQVWTSILLLLIVVILSFTPIVTLNISDEETVGKLQSFISEMGIGVEIDIPSEIEVSAPKLYGCISLFAKMISAAGSADSQTQQEIQDMVKTEDGKNSLLVAGAFAMSVVDLFGGDEEGGKSDMIAMTLKIMVVFICLLYVLFFTLVMPIICVISALIALIHALKNLKTPENAAATISKKLLGLITLPMLFILFQCVLPTMHYASGAFGIWIACFVCVAICLITTRLHAYTPAQMKYANVLQGSALVAAIGYLVFFFNIINAGVFNSFISGKWGAYVTEVALIKSMKGEVPSIGYIVDAVLVLLAVLFVISSVDYFKNCINRLTFTENGSRSKKAKDSYLVSSIFNVLIYAFPVYVMGATNCLKDPTSTSTEGAESFLVISAEQNDALNAALIGIIIMLVAEIAFLVMKKVLCKDLPATEMEAVLGGTAFAPEVAAPAEEAVAASAEAPVEETAAEEAPAEEAPAEEAPAEEAPAEEETQA